MIYTPLPLIALALFHDSLGAVLALRVPARVRRRLVRRRRAVRQRLVPAGAPGLRPRRLRGGHGRHRARRAHRAEHRRRVGSRGPVLGRRRRRRRSCAPSSGCSRATPRAPRDRGPAPGDVRGAVGLPEQRTRVGADALLLPGLRRLRRDVPLPAQAAHRRPRPHQGRRRRARRRVRAARRPRAPDRRLAVRPHRRRARPADLVHGRGRVRGAPRRRLHSDGPAHDLLPDDGRGARPRHGRRVQARPRVVPRPGRLGHRRRRRGRRPRRLLPAAGDGHRQVRHRRLRRSASCCWRSSPSRVSPCSEVSSRDSPRLPRSPPPERHAVRGRAAPVRPGRRRASRRRPDPAGASCGTR